jgi:hypothetical protein
MKILVNPSTLPITIFMENKSYFFFIAVLCVFWRVWGKGEVQKPQQKFLFCWIFNHTKSDLSFVPGVWFYEC